VRISCSMDEVKRIRPEELKEILERDKTGQFVLVDVRQPEEYRAGHIPGARLVPLGELEARHGELEKNKKIVIYCRSGHRSMGAIILLCGLGFKDIYTMDGGILDWNYEILTGLPEGKPELVTENGEVGDVLMIALKLEKGSREFYVRVAGKVKSQKTIKTFQRLAQIEEKHMERIYARYGEVLGKDKLPAFNSLKQKLSPEYMEGGIKINKALLKIEEREFRDEMEALEVALEKEYMSYDFYKRAAGVMADVDTRDLLHELAWEERKHINSLLSNIKDLVKGESR
jgi:rhodanese-related sulfurtransferase/rubrerythrin